MLLGVGIATTRLIGSTSSLMCLKKRNGYIEVEVPNKSVREFYKQLDIEIPSTISLKAFISNTIKISC